MIGGDAPNAHDARFQIGLQTFGIADAGGIDVPLANAVYRNVTEIAHAADQALLDRNRRNTHKDHLLGALGEPALFYNDLILIERNSIVFCGNDAADQDRDRNDEQAGTDP